MTRRINVATLPVVTGTLYPPPFDEPCRARQRTRLADVAGLTQYGVNLVCLKPGAWSSQRHWHIAQDEFIYILSGEVTLVTNAGVEILRTGDCAGFKAGAPDGHHFQNRSASDALILEVGSRMTGDSAHYPDIDLLAVGDAFLHRDRTPYAEKARKA